MDGMGCAHKNAVHRQSELPVPMTRSEEHTSELQSQSNLVCRLLLEKKKKHNCEVSNESCHCNHRPTHSPRDARVSHIETADEERRHSTAHRTPRHDPD